MPVPIYLIAAADSRARTRPELPGDSAEVFASIDAWPGFEQRPPGILLVDPSAGSEAAVLALADEVAALGDEWTLGVIDGEQDAMVRSLAFGPAAHFEAVLRYAEDPESEKGVLLDLRRTLSEVARVRHDVNNPLTAALAEVQLLLFDVQDAESKESLEVTQTQLRRIRDMLASTAHLRPPHR